MKPEDEVKKRMREIFNMRNLAAMSKRTGYPLSTLQRWRSNPLQIKAVDLIRLENMTGVAR